MQQIIYRKATSNDCLEIATLKGIVWNTTYKGIYSDDSLANYDIPKNQGIFEQIVNNPDIELYVATDNDKIVGFMTCGKPYKPFQDFRQEVGLLYILKEYQRQGIGRQFFRIARKHVLAGGHDKFLVSVSKQNQNAIDFYSAMGGQVIDITETQLKLEFHVNIDKVPTTETTYFPKSTTY